MSNTSDIIDAVLPQATGWSRSSGYKNLLKGLEQGLLSLYEGIRLIHRGTENDGLPPYLYTEDDVYTYDVSSSNLSCGSIERTIGGTSYVYVAKRVVKMFIDVTNGSSDYGTNTLFGIPYPAKVGFINRVIADVIVETTPGLKDTPPTVTFLENPGAHEDRYYIEIEIEPPALTSENIPLPVPPGFNMALIEYLIGYVQFMDSGIPSPLHNRFEDIHKPKFRNLFHSVQSTRPKETSLRTC